MSPRSQEYTQQGAPVVSRATIRFIGSSPRKVRLVADKVRSKTVAEAFGILRFLHRPSGTPHIRRALLSAVKNAEAVYANPEKLVIGELQVNDGPMLKRVLPMPMGRAGRVRKRSCHISIFLTEAPEAPAQEAK